MVLVVSPLNPLMFDQMEKLKATAVPGAAIYESQTQEMLEEIRNGDYSLVYTSPESMLASDHWRSVLSSEEFRTNCEVIVIDEAYCIVYW